ncbi:MAG: amidohydrolase family protein [Hyphomicrobiales bacterium]|nr:amidohydrolase family protein [Hyphomicrobiales bacterium]
MQAPLGACDTHAHIFGPASKYPYAENRSYTPPDALIPDYLRLLEVLGFERGIIVHASVQGTNNTATLDALAQLGGNFRGVAVVAPDITRKELVRLDEAGMRGARMTTFVAGGTGAEHLEVLAKRIAEFGWLAEVHLGNVEELVEISPLLTRLPTPYLIDHFGRVRGNQGVDNPGFQALLRLLSEDDKCWVKLCSFYRLSSSGPPDYADMAPMARALVETRPDRLVWGSNWPHPAVEGPMPNDGDLLDLMLDWAPDEAVRNRILAENPARLFGFS